MTTIQRRRATVKLYHGHYQQALADLVEEGLAALRAETVKGGRFGGKSEATAKAVEYDEMAKEAEETTTTVWVYALLFDEIDALQEEHPPREDEARDKSAGFNVKTYLRALAECSLVPPEEIADIDDFDTRFDALKAKGKAALTELGLTRVNYFKVETAAWNVNVGDDAIPKESFASLLKALREPDSTQQPDSEPAPASSKARSPKKRTRTTTQQATSPDEPSSLDSPSGTTETESAP